MRQIKDLPQRTSAEETDFLVLQSITGETYKINKADLFAGLSSGGGNSDNYWLPTNASAHQWIDIGDNDRILVDGSLRLTQAVDKSGNNRDFFQSSDSLKPLVTIGLNSKKIITFDGSNDYIRVGSSFNPGSNIDMYFVARYANTSRRGLFDTAPGVGNTGRNLNNVFDWWNLSPSLPFTTEVNAFDIICIRFQLTPTRILSYSLNGGAFTSASSTNTTALAWGLLTLGTINTNQEAFNGSLAEFVMTPNLGTDGYNKMIGYLAHNWDLTSKLASNHPYKTSRPTITA